jgi:hypothetical protein
MSSALPPPGPFYVVLDAAGARACLELAEQVTRCWRRLLDDVEAFRDGATGGEERVRHAAWEYGRALRALEAGCRGAVTPWLSEQVADGLRLAHQGAAGAEFLTIRGGGRPDDWEPRLADLEAGQRQVRDLVSLIGLDLPDGAAGATAGEPAVGADGDVRLKYIPELTFVPGGFVYRNEFTPLSGYPLKCLRAFGGNRWRRQTAGDLKRVLGDDGGMMDDKAVKANVWKVRQALRSAMKQAKVEGPKDPLPVVDRGPGLAWRLEQLP